MRLIRSDSDVSTQVPNRKSSFDLENISRLNLQALELQLSLENKQKKKKCHRKVECIGVNTVKQGRV